MSGIHYGSAGGSIAAGVAEHNRIRIPYTGILRYVGNRITGNVAESCISGLAIMDKDAAGNYTLKTMRKGQYHGGQVDFAGFEVNLPVIQGQYIQVSMWAPNDGNWFVTYELEV